MQLSSKVDNQTGFTVVEMLLSITVILIIASAVFSLMRDSMKVAATTFEMTDAQEGLRTAQEYLNRDLMNAGDGLNSINNIRVARGFTVNFLALNPVDDSSYAGMVALGIVTSDDNTAQNTPVLGTNPAVNVRWNPVPSDQTDRISILQIDPSFTPITLDAGDISSNGSSVTIAAADVGRFQPGEIYFISSTNGATFGTVTNITNTPSLSFAAGDPFGLNSPGNGGPINVVSAGGTLPTSLMRIRIIHYYVNANGILRRRVFGVSGAGFTDSLITENVISTQFRYLLSLRDAGGNVVQPQTQLTTSDHQLALNQVEVTITAETTRVIQNNSRQRLTTFTSTSVRNLQFRGALQPTAGG